MTLRIGLVCDLIEERWPSMDLVGDMLAESLPRLSPDFEPIVMRAPMRCRATRLPLAGKWIWIDADPRKTPGGETVTFRKTFELAEAPLQAVAAIACDNSYVLYVNGKQVQAGANWKVPDTAVVTGLKAGGNEMVIVAKKLCVVPLVRPVAGLNNR